MSIFKKSEARWSKCGSAATTQQKLRAWYQRQPGIWLQQQELELLESVISDLFGYHILQIGFNNQQDCLRASRITHRMVMDADVNRTELCKNEDQGNDDAVEYFNGEPEYIPLASDSLDVLVLSHTLEYCTNPHEVLRETDRILIPEGHVVILGFNPWGLWMLWRMVLGWRGNPPWCGRFISMPRLKDWLQLLGFEITGTQHYFFRPPFGRTGVMDKLKLVEKIGRLLWPVFSGAYMIVAKKRVATLTPIKPRWRPRRSRLVAADLAGNSSVTNRSKWQKK